MRGLFSILPKAQLWGGGPAKLVEGSSGLSVSHNPSTTLRAVPLPICDGEDYRSSERAGNIRRECTA
jgi:hypothetical protein